METPVQGLCFHIYGRVQGVGFRYFTQKRALELGVCGTVQNEPDGHVFVQAVHQTSVLETFRQSLEKGPLFAKVTRIDSAVFDPTTLDDPSSFQILR